MPNDTATAPAAAPTMPAPAASASVIPFTPRDAFELSLREAKVYASSALVPALYQGDVANCTIALNMAKRMNADALMVMQHLYIVHGRPGWSGQFLIATFNQCGRFSAMRFEQKGAEGTKEWGFRAWAIEKATGEKLHGPWVTWKMVEAEGWSKKSGSKWLTMPELMFHYRAGAFMVRTYAPELSMGLPTAEELQDIGPVDVTVQGSAEVIGAAAVDKAKAAVRGAIDVGTGELIDAGGAAPAVVAGDRTSAGPAITYATVMDAINKAATPDILDLAADMVDAIDDEKQRAELTAAAEARRKELAK